MKKSFIRKKMYIMAFLLSSAITSCATSINPLERVSKEKLSDDTELEKTLKTIYFNAFSTIYKEYWTADFEKQSIVFLDEDIEAFKKNDQDSFLITVSREGTIAGWALFYKQGNRAVLEFICVDPDHWKRGLGRQLTFSIRNFCPDIVNIALVSRTINKTSPLFYESMGFKKTNFTLPHMPVLRCRGLNGL